jgi:hypothetical protein
MKNLIFFITEGTNLKQVSLTNFESLFKFFSAVKIKKEFQVCRGYQNFENQCLRDTEFQLSHANFKQAGGAVVYSTMSHFKLRFKDCFAFKPTMLIDGGGTPLFFERWKLQDLI